MPAILKARQQALVDALKRARLPFTLIDRNASRDGVSVFLVPCAPGIDAEIRLDQAHYMVSAIEHGRAYSRGSLCTVDDVAALMSSWRKRAKAGAVL